MSENTTKGTEFDGHGFWAKLKKLARKAGKELVKMALTLFYALMDPATPIWAKTVIASALIYLVCPVDAIPDITPIVGFTDDVGVLTAALAAVTASVTDGIRERAQDTTDEWFE